MTPEEFWKNFSLGEELNIAGTFIYNGLRSFYEMQSLGNIDEVFESLYNLAVGLERLLKVAVVLIEHDSSFDQNAFEESLITHGHLELLNRIKGQRTVQMGKPHNELLSLLSKFYKSYRYDRYLSSSIYSAESEKSRLRAFLDKHLPDEKSESSFLLWRAENLSMRHKHFMRKLVTKLTSQLFEVVRERAFELNIFTYELRSGSKAEAVFYMKADIYAEEALWKELLIFFMNTPSSTGLLEYMRGIEPLEFDPHLAEEYLSCFSSNSAKGRVLGELEALYEMIDKPKDRLEEISLITNPNIMWDWEEDDDETESYD